MDCPYCKEEIQEEAIKCKHCGSLIIKSGGAQATNLKQLFFSFQGRIPRSVYWLKYALPYLVIYIVLSFLDIALGVFDPNAGMGLLAGLFSLLALWPSLAMGVKRAHDRNRSGWFLLLMVIPLVNIWPFIELGFLKGTAGANKFGENPLTP